MGDSQGRGLLALEIRRQARPCRQLQHQMRPMLRPLVVAVQVKSVNYQPSQARR
jgi:hypothetical protein